MRAKKSGEPEQGGFHANIVLGSPANNNEVQSVCSEFFQYRHCVADDELMCRTSAIANRSYPSRQNAVQVGQIFFEQTLWRRNQMSRAPRTSAAALQLVNGRLAVERENIREQASTHVIIASPLLRSVFQKCLQHDVRPAMTQPGKRSVEIKNNMRYLRPPNMSG